MEPKLYVLVRTDMSWGQRAVQAGHAVAEWLKRGGAGWGNGTLVYLRVRDEADLLEWLARLPGAVEFREPDMGGQATALAVLGPPGMLPGLQLL